MLEVISFLITLLVRSFGVYMLVVALFALGRPKKYPTQAPKLRFACLIAARNEEAVIGGIVQSLRAQNYPAALCDVYVIPNNCTDHTAEAAHRAGAKLFRCTGKVASKGDALGEAFAHLMKKDYDAFCVFDADNLVHPDFLARMNDAMQAGAQVCKGAMRAQNPYESALAGCYGLYFTMMDTFFSRARMNCGLSSKLVGTGFAVRRDALEALGGWRTRTLAEDAEFSALCAEAGLRVHFVPEALTWDEAPNDVRVSLRQRRRWCSGILEVARQRDGALLRALREPHRRRVLDSLLLVNAGYVQVLGLVPLLCGLLSALWTGDILPFVISLAAAAVGSMALGALLAFLGKYRDRRILRSVALFPLFMASFLPLQVLAVFRRTKVWQPIRHTGAVRQLDAA